MAAPTPWTALNTSRTSSENDKPQARELRANTRSPETNSLLMAPLSAILPMTRISPAMTRKYTVTTQEVVPRPMFMSAAMSGRTTLTMVPSRPSRNSASAMTTRSSHCLLGSSITLSMAGGMVRCI